MILLNGLIIKGKLSQNSIDKAPSAELENQYDPFDYEIIAPLVDLIINDNMEKQNLIDIGYNEETIDDILNKIYLSEYKRRQAPPGIKISMALALVSILNCQQIYGSMKKVVMLLRHLIVYNIELYRAVFIIKHEYIKARTTCRVR